MSKIIVDIKGELKNDDILIYDGKNFKPCNKNDFLYKIFAQNMELKDEIKDLKNEIVAFKDGVNEKLKNYHDILQTLTKEE